MFFGNISPHMLHFQVAVKISPKWWFLVFPCWISLEYSWTFCIAPRIFESHPKLEAEDGCPAAVLWIVRNYCCLSRVYEWSSENFVRGTLSARGKQFWDFHGWCFVPVSWKLFPPLKSGCAFRKIWLILLEKEILGIVCELTLVLTKLHPCVIEPSLALTWVLSH